MGTEQEIFDSGNEDETEVGTAQAPPLAEDEASAQEQAAQKPPQGKAPDPAAQGAASQQEPDKPNYTVPLPEHLSVRERAQRAEQERDQLRQALEQFQRREQEAQRAAQAKPLEAPDQFADPQGYTNFMLQQQQQIAHALRQEARMERLNESLEDAAEQYGEAWQAAFNALVATQDRTLVDKLTANPRRAGKAIMDWHRQQEVLRTECGQRKRRLGSRSYHYMEIRWGMSQQELNCVMNGRIAHTVIVLQKKADLFINLCQAVNQRRYDRRRADHRSFEDESDRGTTHSVMGVLQRVG